MTTTGKLRKALRNLIGDESGAIATEYVILLVYLVVATIWLNKTTDSLIFGVSPLVRQGNPNATEAILAEYDGTEMRTQLDKIQQDKKNSYMGQMHIHIGRP